MERLKKDYQYRYVYKNGVSASDKYFTVVAAKGNGEPRFGFSISKKYGKAVKRNRLRRQLKESCMRLLPFVKRNMNFIIIPHAETEDFALITQCLEGLFKRLNGWNGDDSAEE